MKSSNCIAWVCIVVLISCLFLGAYNDNLRKASEAARQQQIIANYRSPVVHSDSERMDWISAHPQEVPWLKYRTDPRHEVDFAIDQGLPK